MTRPTAKQVAERAGVSVAAVSRAFRAGAPLAADKRAAILRVAAEIGYQSPADRLSRGAEQTVTLVASDLSNPFYPMAIEVMASALARAGKRALLYVAPPGVDLDEALRQILDLRSPAVVILSSTISSTLAQRCRANGVPAILFNRVQIDADMTAVTCDNYGGARLVAQRFLQAGRRRIGFMGGIVNTSTHLERGRGFRDQLAEAGKQLAFDWNGGYDYRRSFDLAHAALARPDRPDALFCANDIMALAVLDACRALGIDVPQDLAVIGFDDIPNAGWQPYRLTTLAQPLLRMATETVALLEAAAAGQSVQGTIRIFGADLVARDSG
ncbi:substrate-binding domain-containing protein [Gemmobacter nectariphilus]|uniref:LacI family DNA-binding transcriptional regulator n=1 Tax=Gemmobacter nectariphilus TaxID=220343 RepID=UPI0004872F0A|nr:substrate-binding domain-containing protein [Gemmobacter nectariphilus]